MRVEKSTKDQVLSKLSEMAKGQEEETNPAAPTDFEDVVKAKDEDALQRKAARARKREERKKRLQQEEEGEQEDEGMDPAMAAMMGFSGFGGGKKN